ncbi:hypothetical protein RBWH47_02954 [Rhodopirellula baltica WH47]|uniref:Uncharacterized protein n=1 Tax=Rhodopirellula baltica WH47 TaxID=991778 RepID=F2AZK8_RHOBT|nr:hypothetical protein RBWH47_02954 [Rhodopirellula baltica WH47]
MKRIVETIGASIFIEEVVREKCVQAESRFHAASQSTREIIHLR